MVPSILLFMNLEHFLLQGDYTILISVLDMRTFPANELIRIALCDDDMSSANYDNGRSTTGIWINLGENWRRRTG